MSNPRRQATRKTAALVGKNIRYYRKMRGMTQWDLARELTRRGLIKTQNNVSSWEMGKTLPRTDILPVLADALGLESPADLFSRTTEGGL